MSWLHFSNAAQQRIRFTIVLIGARSRSPPAGGGADGTRGRAKAARPPAPLARSPALARSRPGAQLFTGPLRAGPTGMTEPPLSPHGSAPRGGPGHRGTRSRPLRAGVASRAKPWWLLPIGTGERTDFVRPLRGSDEARFEEMRLPHSGEPRRFEEIRHRLLRRSAQPRHTVPRRNGPCRSPSLSL